MDSSESHSHDGGTIDLPIIDISEMSYEIGKEVLDAFVSCLARFTESISRPHAVAHDASKCYIYLEAVANV